MCRARPLGPNGEPLTTQFYGLLVIWVGVKTTVELPDELLRALKLRAVSEGRPLKDTMAELLRRGLEAEDGEAGSGRPAVPKRVRLPLVRCTHPAPADQEMSPARVSDVLAAQEAADAGSP